MIRTLFAVMILALAALAGLIPTTAPTNGAAAASVPAQPAQPPSSLLFIENAGQFAPRPVSRFGAVSKRSGWPRTRSG